MQDPGSQAMRQHPLLSVCAPALHFLSIMDKFGPWKEILGREWRKVFAPEGVASASDIDTAMRLGYKHPMGPLELSDMVGLDVRKDILNGLSESLGDERYLPHPLLEKLVNEGSLGKKTGVGIYNWKDGKKTDREDLGGR